MKNPKKVAEGKKARAQGGQFELRVRKDLEEKGWIVDRWTNQVELQKENSLEVSGFPSNGKFIYGRLVSARPRMVFNPIIKRMIPQGLNSGFPDFIAFRSWGNPDHNEWEMMGVEVKMEGILDREEKEKCEWLLKSGTFSKILVASKTKVKNKIVVVYEDFEEINKRRRKK